MDISLKEQIALIVEWAEEKKAESIRSFDVEGKTDYTDAILVCEGSGELHNRAIADNIIASAKNKGIYVMGKEGYTQGNWILIDMVNVIVHIFDHDTRSHYDIEKLWDASIKLREQTQQNSSIIDNGGEE